MLTPLNKPMQLSKFITQYSNLFLLSSVLLISACSIKLDRISPDGTDLSGVWLLDESASQRVVLQAQGRQANTDGMSGGMGGGGAGMGGNATTAGNGQTGQGGGRGGQATTPAMRAQQMTIEQNYDSMGVAYPNELYRDVDWGNKEFFREIVNAGWQENALIIISESEQMTLTETYQLNPAGNVLTQTISIESRGGANEFVRVFNKKVP